MKRRDMLGMALPVAGAVTLRGLIKSEELPWKAFAETAPAWPQYSIWRHTKEELERIYPGDQWNAWVHGRMFTRLPDGQIGTAAITNRPFWRELDGTRVVKDGVVWGPSDEQEKQKLREELGLSIWQAEMGLEQLAQEHGYRG